MFPTKDQPERNIIYSVPICLRLSDRQGVPEGGASILKANNLCSPPFGGFLVTFLAAKKSLAEPPGDRGRKVQKAIKLGYRRKPVTTQTEK